MKYDDASWHYGAENFPKELPQSAGATHTGMFVAWAMLSGFASELHIDESQELINRLEGRTITHRDEESNHRITPVHVWTGSVMRGALLAEKIFKELTESSVTTIRNKNNPEWLGLSTKITISHFK